VSPHSSATDQSDDASKDSKSNVSLGKLVDYAQQMIEKANADAKMTIDGFYGFCGVSSLSRSTAYLSFIIPVNAGKGAKEISNPYIPRCANAFRGQSKQVWRGHNTSYKVIARISSLSTMDYTVQSRSPVLSAAETKSHRAHTDLLPMSRLDGLCSA
jgi:hypothetical protein